MTFSLGVFSQKKRDHKTNGRNTNPRSKSWKCIKEMNKEKAVEPDLIPVEVYEALDERN